jgi:hypothetical protein
MAKRQFYFTAEERDLLRTAVGFLRQSIVKGTFLHDGHEEAAHYTKRRIDELLQRIKEKDDAAPQRQSSSDTGASQGGSPVAKLRA